MHYAIIEEVRLISCKDMAASNVLRVEYSQLANFRECLDRFPRVIAELIAEYVYGLDLFLPVGHEIVATSAYYLSDRRIMVKDSISSYWTNGRSLFRYDSHDSIANSDPYPTDSTIGTLYEVSTGNGNDGNRHVAKQIFHLGKCDFNDVGKRASVSAANVFVFNFSTNTLFIASKKRDISNFFILYHAGPSPISFAARTKSICLTATFFRESVISVHSDGIREWDFKTGKRIRPLVTPSNESAASEISIGDACFTSDNIFITVNGLRDPIQVFSLSTLNWINSTSHWGIEKINVIGMIQRPDDKAAIVYTDSSVGSDQYNFKIGVLDFYESKFNIITVFSFQHRPANFSSMYVFPSEMIAPHETDPLLLSIFSFKKPQGNADETSERAKYDAELITMKRFVYSEIMTALNKDKK